jgi:hypothetical protein
MVRVSRALLAVCIFFFSDAVFATPPLKECPPTFGHSLSPLVDGIDQAADRVKTAFRSHRQASEGP